MGFACLPAVRELSNFTRGDHLMRLMARSSLPASLMFIVYTRTLSFVPPRLCPFLFQEHQPQKQKIKSEEKNGRWKSLHCSYYKKPKGVGEFTDLS
jgi:hypothetical protein